MPNSFMMNCVLILKEKNPEYMIISIVKSLFIYHNSLLTCISLIQGTKFQMSVLPHISYTTLKILLHDSELKLSKQCQNYFFVVIKGHIYVYFTHLESVLGWR